MRDKGKCEKGYVRCAEGCHADSRLRRQWGTLSLFVMHRLRTLGQPLLWTHSNFRPERKNEENKLKNRRNSIEIRNNPSKMNGRVTWKASMFSVTYFTNRCDGLSSTLRKEKPSKKRKWGGYESKEKERERERERERGPAEGPKATHNHPNSHHLNTKKIPMD